MISSVATLVEKQESANGQVVHLLFQSETKIPFLEGQFMMLECQLRSGLTKKKPYSIATAHSMMESSNLLGFYVKQEGEGGCSEYLTKHIQLGESVHIKGPVGHFVDDRQSKNYLFLSTGSGLAPNLSILRRLCHDRMYDKIAFVFGERDAGYMLEELENLMQNGIEKNPEKEFFQLCYSKEIESLDYAYQSGYIQTQIPRALQFLGNRRDCSVFLCGKPEMVEQCLLLLLASGVPKERVTIEKY